jgi:hypothetical protein
MKRGGQRHGERRDDERGRRNDPRDVLPVSAPSSWCRGDGLRGYFTSSSDGADNGKTDDKRRRLAPSDSPRVHGLAAAVKVALGPTGRSVALDKKFESPTITKDGVTATKEIEQPPMAAFQTLPGPRSGHASTPYRRNRGARDVGTG